MSGCMLCPRRCGAQRETKVGYCGAGALPNVARTMLHQWEEPCISGSRGTGAVFFCGCNLSCIFCQNQAINHTMTGQRMDASALCDALLALQAQGAQTIDLVTPTPHIETILPALRLAKAQGMTLPVVYNTNAYETPETLRRLEGWVDVYLPDLKYVRSEIARAYSGCADYFTYAGPALQAMYAQVGELTLAEDGGARRGLIVRHLVLPGAIGETRRVLDSIAQTLPLTTHISLMGQYVPCNGVAAPLNRRLLPREYARAVEYCASLGFTNVLTQALSSANSAYTPDFYEQSVNKCQNTPKP